MSAMEYDYEFVVVGPLEVEETLTVQQGGKEVPVKAILSGIFLRLDHVTGNGREYQSEEGGTIAASLIGMPVYFGAKLGIDPVSLKVGFRHIKKAPNMVGRVIRSIYNKANKTIKGAVEVWNTAVFPNLVSKLKKGWGFSIGGRVRSFLDTGKINEYGNEVKKAIGMIANHMQLLAPKIPRGQKEAQVEDIQAVEEALMFDPCPWGVCEVPEVAEEVLETPSEPVPKRVIDTFIYTDDPYSTVI